MRNFSSLLHGENISLYIFSIAMYILYTASAFQMWETEKTRRKWLISKIFFKRLLVHSSLRLNIVSSRKQFYFVFDKSCDAALASHILFLGQFFLLLLYLYSKSLINSSRNHSLCLTDHSVRYIVFHRVFVFLATPMCYIPFERVFVVDYIEPLSVCPCVYASVR